MITIQLSETIQLPVAEVYAFLGCYENDIHWRTGVTQMQQDIPGLAKVGMHTHEVMHFMGSRSVTIAEIVAAELNHRTAFRSVEGPVKAWGQRLFTPLDRNATRFSYELNLQPTGLMRLLSPLVRYFLMRQLQQDMTRLKRHLEQKKIPVYLQSSIG